MPTTEQITVRAPGRVNLIGDHTDYTGGLVLPMAIDRWTEIIGTPGGGVVQLASRNEAMPAVVPIGVDDPASLTPPWARYVAGVVAEARPARGFSGTVTTTIPVGAGLSSSAALEVAVALAIGVDAPPVELAQLCQKAEQRASGVPCGIMDQLICAAGVDGHAVMIDCHELSLTPVVIPDGAEVVVIYGHHRTLAGSEYADRVAECARAEAEIGPLRLASLADVATIADPLVQRRARHVVAENTRVRQFAAALAAGDLRAAGHLMGEAHRSIRDDFETSTPTMDRIVADIAATPGVFGARMTGGGFGGCVVALAEPGALTPDDERDHPVWVTRPVAGAAIVEM